jgi:hypothetical protein
MTNNPYATCPGADATPDTHPPIVLRTKNVGPSPEQSKAQPQLLGKIKKMSLHLPHPNCLDVLPSPTIKWSTTTHPNKGEIFGFINSPISYQHFYFHH